MPPSLRCFLPFHWLRDKNVFCLMLSSMDLDLSDDGLFIPEGIKYDKLRKQVEGASTSSNVYQSLWRRALRMDIPFVSDAQLRAVETIVQALIDYEDEQIAEDFKRSFKLIGIHHPFTRLPFEIDLEAFDNVVNGPYIANELSRLGFNFMIHGHKFLDCLAIDRGIWTSKTSTKEMVSIVGGIVFWRHPPLSKSSNSLMKFLTER